MDYDGSCLLSDSDRQKGKRGAIIMHCTEGQKAGGRQGNKGRNSQRQCGTARAKKAKTRRQRLDHQKIIKVLTAAGVANPVAVGLLPLLRANSNLCRGIGIRILQRV